MLIDEKINELQNLIQRKITYEEIAKILGKKSGNVVRNWSYRQRQLEEFEIQKLDEYFGKNKTEQNKIYQLNNNQLEVSDSEPKIKADYYPDVFGSCGGGAFVLSETKEQIEIPLKCFNKPFNKIKKYSVINAYGSSMQPFIFDSDKLIIEHSEADAVIQDDKVYVFAYDNQIFIKRLYYNVDEIIVKSDNPDTIFKVKYISKEQMEDFILIGQVVGIMRDCR